MCDPVHGKEAQHAFLIPVVPSPRRISRLGQGIGQAEPACNQKNPHAMETELNQGHIKTLPDAIQTIEEGSRSTVGNELREKIPAQNPRIARIVIIGAEEVEINDPQDGHAANAVQPPETRSWFCRRSFTGHWISSTRIPTTPRFSNSCSAVRQYSGWTFTAPIGFRLQIRAPYSKRSPAFNWAEPKNS